MPSPPSPASAEALRILLLEDVRLDAELLIDRCALQHPHWQFHWVATEADFLAQLAVPGYDVILSDYSLPGFSGREALAHARQQVPDTPFIFVSGVIGEENAVEMLKLGATDYVIKGRYDRLPVVIDRALREVAQRRQREAVERQLRRADAMYGRLVESLKDYAVFMLTPEGRVQSCNAAAQTIFGYELDELIGQSAALLFLPEDRARGEFERSMDIALTEGRISDERWLRRKSGRPLWGDCVTTPLFDEAGEHTGFSKIVRDTTFAHESAELLRAAKEEAERANRAKDRFLAVLSHELRTPLMPIAAAAQLLERRAQVPVEYAGLLPMIKRNVALEARLIDDLLDLTSIGQGKLQLQKSVVDVHEVLRTAVEMLEADATRKQLSVSLSLASHQPLLEGDPARLLQIVLNVVRNAVKFTPNGGRVQLSTFDEPGGWLVVACADTGIGIRPDALERIFTAFDQADEQVSRTYGGLGLGLAIASGLAVQHGGSLQAASEGPGRGAVFTLRLPANLTADAAIPTDTETSAERKSFPVARLLLVEDSADAAESLRLALQALDYEVSLASTLREGLDLAGAQAFDVIVTDIGLPDGSGIEMGRRYGATVPLIALSGFGSEDDVSASMSAGFASHLAKPIDPDALHQVIDRILQGRH